MISLKGQCPLTTFRRLLGNVYLLGIPHLGQLQGQAPRGAALPFGCGHLRPIRRQALGNLTESNIAFCTWSLLCGHCQLTLSLTQHRHSLPYSPVSGAILAVGLNWKGQEQSRKYETDEEFLLFAVVHISAQHSQSLPTKNPSEFML